MPIGENVTTYVELSGPFFQRQPGKTLYHNIGEMLEKLAAEMESGVRADIASHQGEMPHWTGYSHDHVQGYVTSPNTGKHWATWAAVGSVTAGMDAKHAIRTKAAAASIERRFHPYRRVKSAVYHARAILSADLSKGMD